MLLRALWAALVLAGLAAAQAGDAKDPEGMVQHPLPADLRVPPAPVLEPAQGLASLSVQSGYRVELVAAEPLVEDPVAIAFDARGRLWVVEMRGFMPDIDGTGEDAPNGRVVVLEDRDRDGRADAQAVFADGLVLPRAVLPVRDGALVLTPPELRFYRDRDADGRAEGFEVVAKGFADGLHNPEHECNGPLPGIDNAIYFARWDHRLRWDGGWRLERVAAGGQWGIDLDDEGRLYVNNNSNWLFAHLIAPHYAVRNPHLRGRGPVNVDIVRDRTVWPARMTPGVNRGYREGVLRDDWTLAEVTAVCGVAVCRGDRFGEGARGDVFACEPAANLVRRFAVRWDGARATARNRYERAEFLTSSDERFRPVNVAFGPDGALYVVDMYRGLIQHRNFVTSFLRRQVEERGLAEPLGRGRIYRVVPAGAAAGTFAVDLVARDAAALVAELGAPVGWRRSTAQRLLVERGGLEVAVALRRAAAAGDPIVRLHAIWTLDGLGELDRTTLIERLRDDDPRVRRAALRLAERRLARDRADPVLVGVLFELEPALDDATRLQWVLTLGAVSGRAVGVRELVDDALAGVLEARAAAGDLRFAVLSGMRGRELEFATRLLGRAGWAAEPGANGDRDGRRAALRDLAECVFRERDAPRMTELLRVAAAEEIGWRRAALLDGVVAALPRPGTRKLRLGARPAELERLAGAGHDRALARLDEAVEWGDAHEAGGARPLTPAEQARFERGAAAYALHCAGCHQGHGLGLGGVAPPLRGSEWVLGDETVLLRVLLHGLTGPIEVAGETFDLPLMPDHARLADDELAAIATWVRRAWDHEADPVEAETVGAVRAEHRARAAPWTAAELQPAR